MTRAQSVRAVTDMVADVPGTLEWIEPSRIQIDRTYQRAASARMVRSIAGSWSWLACGAMVVGRRADGSLYAVDGQHRILAAIAAKIPKVPCVVMPSSGVALEAGGFRGIQTNRRGITAVASYTAALVAGDPDAVEVDRVLRLNNVSVHGEGSGTFKAVAWCMTACHTDKEKFQAVLTVFAKICALGGVPLVGRMLSAGWILASSDEGMSSRVVDRIHQIGAVAIEAAIHRQSVAENAHGAIVSARGLVAALNKGLKRKITLSQTAEDDIRQA